MALDTGVIDAGLSIDAGVVAIDQRGYNRSSRPAGVEAYAMPELVADVAAVIRHFGATKATIAAAAASPHQPSPTRCPA